MFGKIFLRFCEVIWGTLAPTGVIHKTLARSFLSIPVASKSISDICTKWCVPTTTHNGVVSFITSRSFWILKPSPTTYNEIGITISCIMKLDEIRIEKILTWLLWICVHALEYKSYILKLFVGNLRDKMYGQLEVQIRRSKILQCEKRFVWPLECGVGIWLPWWNKNSSIILDVSNKFLSAFLLKNTLVIRIYLLL